MKVMLQSKREIQFLCLLITATILTSCGSFQYAGYANDGIYSNDEQPQRVVEDIETNDKTTTTDTKDSEYYKNYFAENQAELNAIASESEIFTDVDSYGSDYTETTVDEDNEPYAGWGQANDQITINIVNTGWGWNRFGWGWNRFGGLYNGIWCEPWGLGWNNWGWGYNPALWGWNNWGWNAGFVGYYGYGYGLGFRGYGYPYGIGVNRFYRGNRLAFNAGRRGYLLYNNGLAFNRRNASALSSRRNSTLGRRSGNATRLNRSSRSRRIGNSSTIRRNSNSSRSIRSSRGTSIRRNNSSINRSRSSRSIRSSSPRSSRSSRSIRSGSSRSSRSSGVRSGGGRRRG